MLILYNIFKFNSFLWFGFPRIIDPEKSINSIDSFFHLFLFDSSDSLILFEFDWLFFENSQRRKILIDKYARAKKSIYLLKNFITWFDWLYNCSAVLDEGTNDDITGRKR